MGTLSTRNRYFNLKTTNMTHCDICGARLLHSFWYAECPRCRHIYWKLAPFISLVCLGLILCIMFIGCTPQKHISSSIDSVRIEVREKIVKDTITVIHEIPVISEKIVTRDTVSHIENKYAYSEAVIDREGYLYHLLETKPVKELIKTEIEYVIKDSIVFRDKEIINTVEIEKQLTKFQNFRLNFFWIFIFLLISYIGLKIWRFFR